MQSSTFLASYKIRLQQALAEGLEQGINTLIQSIDDLSSHKLNIFQLKGRFNELEEDSIQGIIKYDDKILHTNQIRASLMEMIGQLTVEDLSMHSTLLSEEEKNFLTQLKNSNTVPPVVLSATRPTPTPTSKAVSYTIEDLEMYKSLNSNWLKFYPIIYRRMSAMIFRGDNGNELISITLSKLKQHESTLKAFSNQLQEIKANESNLRNKEKSEYYDLMIRKHTNFKSQLTEENIDEIEKYSEQLNSFSTELKEASLI